MLDSCSGDECESDLLLNGSMTIKLQLSEPLKTEHVLMLYAVSPDTFDIEKDLNVRITNTVI